MFVDVIWFLLTKSIGLLALAGSREDLSLDIIDSKEENVENAGGGSNYSESMSQEKQVYSYGVNTRVETLQEYQKVSDYKLSSEGTCTKTILSPNFFIKLMYDC